MNRDHEDLLRRLAVNDEGVLERLLGAGFAHAEPQGLDDKTVALVRLAGLIALEAAPASYQWSVTIALAAGATDGEVAAVLVALAPIVGIARASSAAPELALAIGCDLGLPGDR